MAPPTIIAYRWIPKDVDAAHSTPPKVATPYGMIPSEISAPSGNPPPRDQRMAVDLEDGDPVPLKSSLCRVPLMLKQFTVDNHIWADIPDGVTGATIGEICSALFRKDPAKYGIYEDFVKTSADFKTAEEGTASVHRKNGIARKLFEYWDHCDYRWAVIHGSFSWVTHDKDPGSLPAEGKATATVRAQEIKVEGKLSKVLTRLQNGPPLSASPKVGGKGAAKAEGKDGNGDGSKAATNTLKKTANPGADPPADSLYLKLDPALRETLKRSFVDRLAGLPDARSNLMFGFPPAPKPPPTTTWEALDFLGLMAVNFLARLFERIRGIDDTLATWKQIKYIRNQWWKGSAGMKVVYVDPPAMRVCLDGLLSGAHGKKVARDAYMGAMEHQSAPMPDLLKDLALNPGKSSASPPDCDTWRELDKLGEEGTHFCVDKEDLKTVTILGTAYSSGLQRHSSHDDIHLDWMNPVQGIDSSTNKCDYNWGTGVEHWWQATQGRGVPIFTFDAINGHIADWETVNASGMNVTDELRDFAKRWRVERKGLAVAGRAGYDQSMVFYKELVGLIKKAQNRFSAIASEPELMRAIADAIPSKSPPLDPGTGP